MGVLKGSPMITKEQLKGALEVASEDMPWKFDMVTIENQIKHGDILERGTASRLKRAILFSKSAAIDPDKEGMLSFLCPVLGSMIIVDVLMASIGIKVKGNLGRYLLSILFAYFQTYFWITGICNVLYGSPSIVTSGLILLTIQSLMTSYIVRKSSQVINSIAFLVVLAGGIMKK